MQATGSDQAVAALDAERWRLFAMPTVDAHDDFRLADGRVDPARVGSVWPRGVCWQPADLTVDAGVVELLTGGASRVGARRRLAGLAVAAPVMRRCVAAPDRRRLLDVLGEQAWALALRLPTVQSGVPMPTQAALLDAPAEAVDAAGDAWMRAGFAAMGPAWLAAYRLRVPLTAQVDLPVADRAALTMLVRLLVDPLAAGWPTLTAGASATDLPGPR